METSRTVMMDESPPKSPNRKPTVKKEDQRKVLKLDTNAIDDMLNFSEDETDVESQYGERPKCRPRPVSRFDERLFMLQGFLDKPLASRAWTPVVSSLRSRVSTTTTSWTPTPLGETFLEVITALDRRTLPNAILTTTPNISNNNICQTMSLKHQIKGLL